MKSQIIKLPARVSLTLSTSTLAQSRVFTPYCHDRRLSSLCREVRPSSNVTRSFDTNKKVRSLLPGSPRNFATTVNAPTPPTAAPVMDKFNVQGKVYIVTGGGRGLGLMMAEGIAEAGGTVYCLDRLPEPDADFTEAKARAESARGGSIIYRRVDVCNDEDLEAVISNIASENSRLDGLVAAAGVQQLTPAIEYTGEDIKQMLDINYTGVFMAATLSAKQMMKYKCEGSIVLVGSMSGFIANKGLISPVYNSSKAAVVQLARSLAMEWGKLENPIRVNSLCPGHIVTPMVQKNFEEVPGLRATWEKENMMGRLAAPDEFKGPALFLLSSASSFMTGSSLICDAGHTAW